MLVDRKRLYFEFEKFSHVGVFNSVASDFTGIKVLILLSNAYVEQSGSV